MATIVFTASIIRKDKGEYVALADELSIAGEPSTTQRGAVKNLKSAVLARFRQAAEAGALRVLFDNAGYDGEMIDLDQMTFRRFIWNTNTISLPLPRSLIIDEKRLRRKRPRRA